MVPCVEIEGGSEVNGIIIMVTHYLVPKEKGVIPCQCDWWVGKEEPIPGHMALWYFQESTSAFIYEYLSQNEG